MNNLDTTKSKKLSLRSESQTKGVKTLLGDPKKAILKLAIPMIVAMSFNTIYNLVDALWVSGLEGGLRAVGFFFPFFFMAMAIAVGIGTGGGAAISRKIGAKDKSGADNVAVHTILIMVISAIIFTIPFLIFIREIFIIIGAGDVIDLVVSYGRIIIAGSIILFFTMVASTILRSEGDANRAMYMMMVGAILNIILDPIFIFTFGYGVAGAAIATIISMSITALIMVNWLFFKKDTYVSFNFRNFHWDKKIVKDISNVGLPASVQQLSMAFTTLIMNIIIVMIEKPNGVGIETYTAGWRVVTIGILPLLGIATAVISVTGAAYGAKDFAKLKTSFMYAVKLGFIIELVVATATFLLAPYIATVFSLREGALELRNELTIFLQVIFLFYPTVAFGMFSSSMFQGTGKGINALIVTIWRTIILAPPFALLFSVVFNMGLLGIWLGLVVANITGSITAFSWARIYLKRLKADFERSKKNPEL